MAARRPSPQVSIPGNHLNLGIENARLVGTAEIAFCDQRSGYRNDAPRAGPPLRLSEGDRSRLVKFRQAYVRADSALVGQSRPGAIEAGRLGRGRESDQKRAEAYGKDERSSAKNVHGA